MRSPHDKALPRLSLLLDADSMAPVLERALENPARVGRVRVARIVYKPGVRVAVHYEVSVDARDEDAVVFERPGRDILVTWHSLPTTVMQKLVAWEIPILGTRLALVRWTVCLALPVLAGLAARIFTRS